jgi:Putative F0F1-ATPase subunit (ATPase_gene1).
MEDRNRPLQASGLATLGFQFAAAIVVFLFAGQWLDKKLGTSPLFVIAGVFLGGGGAFYRMYRKITARERDEDEKGKQ